MMDTSDSASTVQATAVEACAAAAWIASPPQVWPPATARVSALDCIVELAGGTSLRVDCLGRWQAARFDGHLYRRVLDGRVVRYPPRRSVPLDVQDSAAVHESIGGLARVLRDRFWDPSVALTLSGSTADRSQLLRHLGQACKWTAVRHERERERFRAAYDEPIEILPPDRYLDVVVLPATGCPNARCSFCAFYRDRRFRGRDEAAFVDHLARVVDLFGPALPLRTGVFLGSASALSLSQRRLECALDHVSRAIGARSRGIAAFWDPDHSPERSTVDWERLHARGLAAVYVGLETGLATLRGRIGKSGDLERLIGALRRQRDVPIQTGLIVLAGVGGPELASDHRRATGEAVEQMSLSRADIVFVSPLRGAMSDEALADEGQQLRTLLRERTAARVVPYAMDAFRYYA